MKNLYLFLALILLLSSCSSLFKSRADLKVVHYNIKELDSQKIKDFDIQVQKANEILKEFDFNVLSLNEVQYDYPNIPNKSFTSKGENIKKFMMKLGRDYELWKTSFYPANTGQRAQKLNNQNYPANFQTPNIMNYADQWNFGIYPGQYSSGLSFDLIPYGNPIVINKLKWKEFNPKVNLNKFKQADGLVINKNIELFDKNFVDTPVEIDGEVVHIITLHTVPSYHFGNKSSPNYKRNADQLRFLEWYTTGKTDIEVSLPGIQPLPPNSYFVALGDWNTDIRNLKNQGSRVLKNYFKKVNVWIGENYDLTHEADGYHPNRLKLLLDYIVTSKNMKIIKGKIHAPSEERLFLGCEPPNLEKLKLPAHRVLVHYFDKSVGKKCYVSISKKFKNYKDASDHFPISADIKLIK